MGHPCSTWSSTTTATSTAGQVRPVPDKYAFQATDEQTDKQMDTAIMYNPSFCGRGLITATPTKYDLLFIDKRILATLTSK